MKISSDFAILDVKDGRKELLRAVDDDPSPARIPVTIKGFIVNSWGSDDGTSQEFQVDVETVTVEEV